MTPPCRRKSLLVNGVDTCEDDVDTCHRHLKAVLMVSTHRKICVSACHIHPNDVLIVSTHTQIRVDACHKHSKVVLMVSTHAAIWQKILECCHISFLFQNH